MKQIATVSGEVLVSSSVLLCDRSFAYHDCSLGYTKCNVSCDAAPEQVRPTGTHHTPTMAAAETATETTSGALIPVMA